MSNPTIRESGNVDVCEDCMFLSVNGERPTEELPNWAPFSGANWADNTPQLQPSPNFGVDDDDTEYGMTEFSATPCESCGATLAGKRFDFMTWETVRPALTITTNGHQRELIAFADLTELEREQFDYMRADTYESHTPRFFRYRAWTYDAQEFTRITPRCESTYGDVHPVDSGSPLLQWDGAQPDTYFSGVLIRWGHDWSGEPDYDSVIVGSWSE